MINRLSLFYNQLKILTILFLRFEKYSSYNVNVFVVKRMKRFMESFMKRFIMKRRAREINLEIIRNYSTLWMSLELILRLVYYKSFIVFLEVKEKYNYLKKQGKILIFII